MSGGCYSSIPDPTKNRSVKSDAVTHPQFEVLEIPALQQPHMYLILGVSYSLRFQKNGFFMFDYENLGKNLSENVCIV